MIMEINITQFFNEACPRDYSASVAEIGANAGQYTWQAACNDSSECMLLDTDDKRQAFREYVKGFGAWDDKEIASWSNVELNAMFIQMISGEIREFRELADSDWQQWQELAERGQVTGNLYSDSLSTDGKVYYYVGD